MIESESAFEQRWAAWSDRPGSKVHKIDPMDESFSLCGYRIGGWWDTTYNSGTEITCNHCLSIMQEGKRWCPKCRESKPLTSFGVNPRTGKPGKNCRACNVLYKEARKLAWKN